MSDQPFVFDDQDDDAASGKWTPPPRVHDLATLFDEPPTRRPVELLPDDADYYYGDAADMLVGLLHDAPDLRVGTLGFEIEKPSGIPGCQAWDGYLVPIVVARGRGAWVVYDCGADAPVEAAEAISMRVQLVELLCEEFGWQPQDVPLGVTLVSTTRDFGPEDDTGDLPRHELIGRSDLPRLAERLAALPVGPPERQGRLTPELAARFFVDLARCGQWLRDSIDDEFAIEIPGRMVRRPT